MNRWLLNFSIYTFLPFIFLAQEPNDSSEISMIQTVSIDTNAVNQFPFIQFDKNVFEFPSSENRTGISSMQEWTL